MMNKVSFSLYMSPDGSIQELDSKHAGMAGRIAGLTELPYGGMVVLSTDVNATAGGIKGVAKRALKTWYNRFTRSKKVDEAVKEQVMKKGIDTGWSVGNLFRGRYFSKKSGKQFNEKSFSVDIRGVPFDFVKGVAKSLMKKFDQESVLVINHENGKSFLLD